MDEYQIRQAFSKVKEDITSLKSELSEIKNILKSAYDEINTLKLTNITPSTDESINKTDIANSTHNSTVRQEIEGLKTNNLIVSTGNEGVSTDRQTDNKTDNSTDFLPENTQNIEKDIIKASEILESLDTLKKEIRFKFKRITPQEMSVFSTIYQLEDQGETKISYKQIASFLRLSESSIRDYVQRMITKGIPLKKQKLDNKKIILSISPELKKIATLSTIIQLREL